MDFKKIETKWQKRWQDKGIFKAKEDPKKKKYYVLEMLPYPSAAGLHMGHVRNYSMGDAFARFKRMQGFNVLYPMGYDAFGLPAENAAIKNHTHPKKYTESAIAGIKKNQKALGLSYDWSREIATCYPDYYKWNQWIFLKMLKKGLAYRKEAPVNWCPKCRTVLANEQVEQGLCWRCESRVETRNLEQWFLRITAYADKLLKNLDGLEGWPNRIKAMQRNWIGRNEWIDIDYDLEGKRRKITVSTTRPDTNYGATFVVIAPEHPLLKEKGLIHKKYRKDVDAYIEESGRKTDEERINECREKTGTFTGLYCVNQLTGKRMPLYVADFVLMSVGTGAVVGVPGHDIRDFEFAKKFGLPIIRVVVGPDGDRSEITRKEQVQEGEGVMINSGFLDGMDIHKATKKIMEHIEKKGWGRRTVRYRLRDWLISRQRYWGTPIPVVYCDKCGMVPVPEKDLPILLPASVEFTGEGNPLTTSKDFLNVRCPKCGGKGRRETDTMDTFMDSNWYFLRYCSPKSKSMFDRKAVDYWMPVDQYIGGAEHAVMHLLYARFFSMVLRDFGLVGFSEPFTRLFNQGIVYKDGHKMSKSFGNAVTQEEIARKYGIDTARLFLLFVAAPDSQLEWSDQGVTGASKFIRKVFNLASAKPKARSGAMTSRDGLVLSKVQGMIEQVTGCIEGFRFNTAISSLIVFTDELQRYSKDPHMEVWDQAMKSLILLLSPFTPHISEELWEARGGKGFVSLQKWPKADEKLIDRRLEMMEVFVSNVKADIENILKIVSKKPKRIAIYTAPEWKHTAVKEILSAVETPNEIVPYVMKNEKFREMGKDALRFAQDLSRRAAGMKDILSEQEEVQSLSEAAGSFREAFGCDIQVVKALESKSEKAIRADPGRPGIEVF